MARILITCWGSYGDVFPYVGLAMALRARGHNPVLAAPAHYRSIAEQEGVAFTPAGPDVDPNDRAVLARVMHPSTGTEMIMRELLMPAVQCSFEELQHAAADADLIVSHPITFAAPVLAEHRRLPWVSTLLAPLSFFSATDPPVFPPAPRLVHLYRLGPWTGRLLVGIAHRVTEKWMEPVYALRARLGLPRGRHPLFEGQFSPAMTLALFSHVMAEPQPDWPPNVQTTGFVFYNGPAALPPALESFLAQGEAPVVFTLGTSAVGAAGRFYHESVEAAARLGVRAVLLTGGFSENNPGKLPASMLIVDSAPHQLLFPHARAVVHQGGIGTTAQALRSGHPMLVVPHGHDQPDNAFRVTRLGVARTIFPREYTARRVAHALEGLLNSPRVAAQSARIGEAVRREGGADQAAAVIEAVLAQ